MVGRAFDLIALAMHTLLLNRSIKSNNIFVWIWTLSQYNCMTWCVSVDLIDFHDFSMGQDSIVIKYDDRKCEKYTGKRFYRKMCMLTLIITVIPFGLEWEYGMYWVQRIFHRTIHCSVSQMQKQQQLYLATKSSVWC